MTDEPRLEERAISQAIKLGLTTQLDDVEAIAVEVKTDLGKLMQGKVDSLSVAGQGVVLNDEIRLQEIVLTTDEVSVNPLSAILGQIKLNEPVNSIARVVLTEADLNQTLNSTMIQERLTPLKLEIDGQFLSLELQFPVNFRLLETGRLAVSGTIQIQQPGEPTRQVAFSTVIQPRNDVKSIELETFTCLPGQGISFKLIVALLGKMNALLALPYFVFEETAFRVRNLVIGPDNLLLEVEVFTQQIPSL